MDKTFLTLIAAAAAALLPALGACGSAATGDTPAQLGSAVPLAAATGQEDAVAAVAAAARPLAGAPADHDEILGALGGATRVMLGESTHGTQEYYRERARLTQRLVREQGFNAIAIEGDWTPTYRLNLYVRGAGPYRSAEEALGGYENFPKWMWANAEFRDMVDRLRAWNLGRPAEQRVGLYGMDVYDLFDAADAVQAYLKAEHPEMARLAARNYRCFHPYKRSTEAYALATREPRSSCRKQAEAVLAAMRTLPRPAEAAAAETHFAALRSAASVAAAEDYYRTAAVGSLAWNVRDRHMADNVDEIAGHVAAVSGRPGKVVMWSHNTHTGDARATGAANRGELNLGQLMRERHDRNAFLVGFMSYAGTVMAAPEWGVSGRVYELRPALSHSHAGLFHRTGLPAFSLLLRGRKEIAQALSQPMLQRAVGVVYQPHTERQSHYFPAHLPEQFDAVMFFDRSRAVTALRR